MKKDKVSGKCGKSTRALGMSSLRNFIYNWKPRYILNYTPLYVFNRTKLFFYELRYPDHPWLTQQANAILSTLLKPADVELEWGSGRSTIWFSPRIKHLTSVEQDEAWYDVVSRKFKEANISNVNYLLCKVEEEPEKPEKSSYVRVVNNFEKNDLDFVLVDGIYRDVCANAVLEKIRPGGIIVIDNANWYIPCDSISPSSRPKKSTPASEGWARSLDNVTDWRLIWTSNGVKDTAIWFKPSGEHNEKV